MILFFLCHFASFWQKGVNTAPAAGRNLLSFGFGALTMRRPPLAPERILMLWTRFWVRKNLAFNLLDSAEFHEAFAATSSYGGEVRLGGRTFMSTSLIARSKTAIMNKLHVLLLDAVGGLYALKFLQPASFHHFSLSGSLALDGWKSKYQISHIFGARFSFITSDWEMLNLVCLCDAGVFCFFHLFLDLRGSCARF